MAGSLSRLHRVLLLICLTIGCLSAHAQTAPELKSGGPESRPGESDDQKARRLLNEMVTALGGDAWLNKSTETIEGQTARFFHGAPTGFVIRFVEYLRFPSASVEPSERIDFVTARSPILMEGYHSDLAHLWTVDHGYEFTYKGRTLLPEDQVKDYLRRRQHTLEEVMRTWVKQPGVMIVYEGIGTRDRHAVEKVSVLAANNDAVTIEMDLNTHLPLQRSFETRNQQFKDLDIDEEVYGDWRAYDGIQTPMNVTRYKNGDIVEETFYKTVKFNRPMTADLFNPEKIVLKK
jgi:hypothetical protein